MRVVAIVQARMGSTRLPGKVLLDLNGIPILGWCLRRLGRAETIDQIVVATSDQPEDDRIASFCEAGGVAYLRGSATDVLDRYYRAATEFQAEAIVRVTSDCPLVDPGITDECVRAFLARQPQVDYVRNVNSPPSYPRGVDVEVFSLAALSQAWQQDTSSWREHVTPYLYRSPQFNVHRIQSLRDWSELRLTVDTPDDLRLVREIAGHFPDENFTWEQLTNAFALHPDWHQINRHVKQRAA